MALRSKYVLALVPVLMAVSLAAAACGGSDNKSSATATKPSGAAAGSPTAGAGSGAANSIVVADFNYTPARFNATAGQQLSLTVTNQGAQPHTFTITGVVDSGTIAPGQTKTVTFTPAQAGNLVYFCTIHGQAAMSGQLMVAGTSGALPASDGEILSISRSAPAATTAAS